MEPFEDEFIESKIQRRPVKECSDRFIPFKLNHKRYIHTTRQEYNILKTIINPEKLKEFTSCQIYEFFNNVLRFTNYEQSFEHDGFTTYFYTYDIKQIYIKNARNIIMTIDSRASTDYRNIPFGSRVYDEIELELQASDYYSSFIIDSISYKDLECYQDIYIDEYVYGLDDDFIEILDNNDDDQLAFMVYEQLYFGSRTMPDYVFSQVFEIYKRGGK